MPNSSLMFEAGHGIFCKQLICGEAKDMTTSTRWRPDLNYYRIPRLDPGYVYVVRTENRVKVGKTIGPRRRFREANTWSPYELEIVGVKPFWNIRRVEYELHTALAEHWTRGEWHEFKDPYYFKFFVDAFRQFEDEDRDLNSAEFAYWMNGTGYAEAVGMKIEHKMTLSEWRECRGDPWRFTRADILDRIRMQCEQATIS
jgi:hypothetical protein